MEGKEVTQETDIVNVTMSYGALSHRGIHWPQGF